jgi:hypothetical protein
MGTGANSTDGEIYITQTTGSSAEQLYGSCTSDHNCGFYYTLTFINTLNFYVRKYDLNDNLIDTIYASATSGDGRYWHTLFGSNDNETITIDIGVNVYIPDVNGFATSDVYKITLPSAEVMRRRRIYHGGYSTFTGNNAVTAFLESSVNTSASHSADGGSTVFEWASGEEWALGTMLANDLDPTKSDTDFPAIAQVPSTDMDHSGTETTGSIQTLQLNCSSKSGYVKLKLAYLDGTGGPTVLAYNQFWPIILLIS